MKLHLPWRGGLQRLLDWVEYQTWRLGPVEERLHQLLKRQQGWVSTVRLHTLYEEEHGSLSYGALYVALGKLEHHHLATYDYRERQADQGYTRLARYYLATGAWDG